MRPLPAAGLDRARRRRRDFPPPGRCPGSSRPDARWRPALTRSPGSCRSRRSRKVSSSPVIGSRPTSASSSVHRGHPEGDDDVLGAAPEERHPQAVPGGPSPADPCARWSSGLGTCEVDPARVERHPGRRAGRFSGHGETADAPADLARRPRRQPPDDRRRGRSLLGGAPPAARPRSRAAPRAAGRPRSARRRRASGPSGARSSAHSTLTAASRFRWVPAGDDPARGQVPRVRQHGQRSRRRSRPPPCWPRACCPDGPAARSRSRRWRRSRPTLSAARAAPSLSVVIERTASAMPASSSASRLSAVARIPVPSGLVSTSTSPAQAPALVSIRSGCTSPTTAIPNIGSGASIEWPPSSRQRARSAHRRRARPAPRPARRRAASPAASRRG